MIEPLPCSTIFGAAARQVSNVVPICASSRSRNCALVTVRIDSLASPAVPAQLTMMSIWPNSLVQVSINASATGIRWRAGKCDGTRDALSRLGCRVGVASVHHNAGALRPQQFGHGQTDAA